MEVTSGRYEMVPVSELVPYEGNAKEHTNAQIDAVKASMSQLGFGAPLVCWHNDDGRPEIVAGHARAIAAKALGIEEVPVVFRDDWTDAQRRAYTLADNQTTMMTGWDDDQLAYELDTLSESFDMGDFGFDLDSVLEDITTASDDVPDDAPERVKLGEVWRMGDHVLLCGDATKPENVRKLLETLGGGVLASLLLTDPPYNVSYDGKTADALTIENDAWETDDGFVSFLAAAFGAAAEGMRPGAAFYVWYASTQSANFLEGLGRSGLGLRQILVWAKDAFTLGRQDYQWRHEPCLYGWKGGAAHSWHADRRQTTVLEFTKPAANRDHPTMKPVELWEYLIRNSSADGEVVLDPFCGSGTTVVACEAMGRRAAAMELDPRYCDVILRRWEDMTGREAERVA